MSEDRNIDLERKPNVKEWIEDRRHRIAAQTFQKVIEYLSLHYTGSNEGYTDNIQYRFNSIREGGYIIVKGRDSNTIVRLSRSVDTINPVEIRIKNNPKLDEADIERTISEFLITNKVRHFNVFANYNRQLESEVEASSNLNEEERRKKIREYPVIPEQIYINTIVFKRNPHIIAERLYLAKGKCDKCDQPAPFKKRNGEPYLEVHHIILLSEGGEDILKNTIALCPNCHREKHFG